ncbi:MAG: ribosome maturation factor RimP [Faecalibacterium sp.]|nr:ribosome maturation factor RimP [Faecalibacterium sp.]
MAKPSGGSTVQKVESLVRPVVEGMGLRLWDVVFEKEGPDWYLRILIDKPDGAAMDTDTCANVSHAVDPILDAADPIEQSYYLEVGSPGLGRKLTRQEHYDLLKGQKVAVKLIRPDAAGCREYSGTLVGRTENTVTVATPAGEVQFAANAASSVRLADDEDLFS